MHHLERDGVAARALELVDVEGQRCAGSGRGDKVVEQRPLVELEVRRPDHRDRSGSRLGRVRRERDGVRGRLGAAMRGDLEPSGGGRDEELERSHALLRPKQQPLPGRAESEQPVEPTCGEEVDVGPEGVLVEPLPS